MDFVKIVVLDNAFEAQLMEETLNDQKIDFYIRSYQDDAYGNLFQMTKGWGALHAQPSDRDKILEILHDIRNSKVIPEADE